MTPPKPMAKVPGRVWLVVNSVGEIDVYESRDRARFKAREGDTYRPQDGPFAVVAYVPEKRGGGR